MMLKRIISLGLFCLLMVSGKAQYGNINLIIYTDFLNPKSTYDNMLRDFSAYGITDSIRIIGNPLPDAVIDIDFDTVKINEYGISFDDIENRVADLVSEHTDLETLMREYITNKEGKKIPVSAFTALYQSIEYYRPEIYLPYPAEYEYQGRPAVKVEFYLQQENEKILIALIRRDINNYSDKDLISCYSRVDYEIIHEEKLYVKNNKSDFQK